jgi:ketosteroid isomerase-like protein
MSDDTSDFTEFMKHREAAARAYVRGEPGLLEGIAVRALPATFFGPHGGALQGATNVSATYRRDAAAFEAGETRFEVLQMAASGGVAYWTGFQHASGRIADKDVRMKLRVTEVFRREGGAWKLVHRHADALGDPKTS